MAKGLKDVITAARSLNFLGIRKTYILWDESVDTWEGVIESLYHLYFN